MSSPDFRAQPYHSFKRLICIYIYNHQYYILPNAVCQMISRHSFSHKEGSLRKPEKRFHRFGLGILQIPPGSFLLLNTKKPSLSSPVQINPPTCKKVQVGGFGISIRETIGWNFGFEKPRSIMNGDLALFLILSQILFDP